MPKFNYVALDARGQESVGTIEASTSNDAVGQLRKHLAEAGLQTARADLMVAVGIDAPTYSEDLPALERKDSASHWQPRLQHVATDAR